MYSGCEEVRQKNPRQTANLLSFLTFGYTLQLFKKGLKGNLQESDIYEVPIFCSSKRCGDKIDDDWRHSKTTLRLLIKRFGNKYFLYTAIHTTWELIKSTIQPYAMSRFIAYFEKNQTRITKQDSYFYGFTIIFLYIFQSLWIHNYFTLECTLGTQIRSSITSLIYRKVIKLRPDQVKGSSMGSIVTILTKDIRTIGSTIWPLSDTILGLIKFFYLTYLLYIRIGIPSLVVTGFMALAVALQAILSKFVLKLRLKVGKKADERLQFTREILSAIKIIKMYTWEAFFHRRVCEARKKETRANVRSWYLGTLIIAFGSMFAKLLFPVFLLSYISFGYSTDTELVYYLMGLFKEFASVIGSLLPNGFGLTAEFYASVVRVGRILGMQEHASDPKEKYKTLDSILAPAKLNFENVALGIDGEAILTDLTLCIDKPGLYMFTGPLGSGKTSILKIILEEYSPTRGHLEVIGNISYASQDPWLFPATVRQNILFGQSFDRERYDKVIEICSLLQDLQNLPNGDNTVIIDGGLNLSKGQQARVNLARAVYKQSDIYLLDDPLACLDVKVQDDIFQACIKRFLKDKIVVLVTQNGNHLKHASKLYILEHGQIQTVIKPEEMLFDENDLLINVPINMDSHRDTKLMKIYHEDKNIGSVDVKNYYRYVKYGGGVFVFAVLVLVFFGAQFTESYSDKLVSQWVDYQQNVTIDEELSYQRDNTFDMYIIMIVFSTVIDLVKSYWFLAYCRKASIRFHKLMSQSIINCVMTFMDTHFIGNILNRFSYDLDHIDEVFPFLFKDLIIAFFGIGGTLVLILTVDWIFLITILLFFATLVLLRAFYIPTARALKRLGAITRSPFIGHLNATVDGLSTIRAFKQENLLKDEFDKHQDLAISVAYMEMLTERAFGYALDLDCSIFISMVILTFLFVDTDTSVGNVGLALTQVFSMSNYLQWIVRVWASIEQCMTSVERVIEYTKIPQENATPPGEKLANWPKYGQIEYRNVNLVYNFQSRVLKNVSFLIKQGEKIGIVGRTGAGKSSVITTLFRLYEYQGNIIIDGVDISKVSLQFLRSNISIIPQDPTIFAGTVRENIDPYGTCLDKDIWRVLKNVKLEASVPSLDENIIDLSLSTGQRQLICFARALLKNNSVVVMDEPTANLDTETDQLLHDLIKLHFSGCTLIMVAHRLHSILDFDKVMVMENGEIVEFDNPRKLMEDTGSLFCRMINVVK